MNALFLPFLCWNHTHWSDNTVLVKAKSSLKCRRNEWVNEGAFKSILTGPEHILVYYNHMLSTTFLIGCDLNCRERGGGGGWWVEECVRRGVTVEWVWVCVCVEETWDTLMCGGKEGRKEGKGREEGWKGGTTWVGKGRKEGRKERVREEGGFEASSVDTGRRTLKGGGRVFACRCVFCIRCLLWSSCIGRVSVMFILF